MKKTYEEIFDFIEISQQWLMKDKADPKEPDYGPNAETKLGYAVQKMLSRFKKTHKRYQARVEETQIDNCMTDEKGRILKDERGSLEFTKEGILKRNAEIQALGEQEIEFEPHIACELPKKENSEIDLSFAELEAFEGFVLNSVERSEEPQREAAAAQASTVQ